MRTSEYATRFELARAIGVRTLQLSEARDTSTDPKARAIDEVLRGTTPFVVRRKLPDGTHEDRPLASLKLTRDARRALEDALDDATGRTSLDSVAGPPHAPTGAT